MQNLSGAAESSLAWPIKTLVHRIVIRFLYRTFSHGICFPEARLNPLV